MNAEQLARLNNAQKHLSLATEALRAVGHQHVLERNHNIFADIIFQLDRQQQRLERRKEALLKRG